MQKRRGIVDTVGEEDAVEVVELVLHRAGAEAAEALDVLVPVGVEVAHLDLGVAREQAAEVGDAEAALVALVGLVADRADDRVDEDARFSRGLYG